MLTLEHIAERSIPACAGEPREHPYGAADGEVYPRVCGGTDAVPAAYSGKAGLSPRVRGNPEFPDGEGNRLGSIPACAGEPR